MINSLHWKNVSRHLKPNSEHCLYLRLEYEDGQVKLCLSYYYGEGEARKNDYRCRSYPEVPYFSATNAANFVANYTLHSTHRK